MAVNTKDYMNIPKEKFEFVHENERLTDKKFDDKPIGYFKDAWIRFRKNRASVVATIIIICIVLFAQIPDIIVSKRNGGTRYGGNKDPDFGYCAL